MAKTPGTGIKIGTHFSPRFKRPIDDRFQFDTVAEMAGFAEAALYDGIKTFVSQDKKTYKYLSTNTIDPTTGKWRVVSNYSSDEIDELLSKKQDIIAVDTLPTITGSSDKTYAYLYKGETTSVAPIYIHGHLYIIGDDNKYHDAYDVYTKSEVDTLLDEKENIFMYDTMPEPSVNVLDRVVQYIGETTLVAPIYKEGHFYKCKFEDPDYVWFDLNDFYTKSEADAKFQDIIQYEVLPEASEDLEGKVYQYIGVEATNRKLGSFYKCVEISTDTYDWIELQPEVESIQKETLPDPTVDLVNKIYQYIGPNVLGGVQKGYFYICVEDSENPGEYIWKQKNVQPSAEGGSTLERDITANVNVGGVTSGKTFLEGTSITDVLESILVKPVYQTVTLTLSEDLVQKIGTTISSVDMTATIVKGDSPITNAKYYVGASLVDTKDSTTDPGIVNGGTYTYEYNTSFSTDTTFKVDVLAGDHTETATKKIQFVNPYYTGSSTTSTISDFTGLTEEIVVKNTKKEVTYGVTDNEYLVFAYNKSYGSLTSIKDENNFENIGSWNKSELTVDGQDYFVYITQLPVTIETTFKYTFII